MVQGLWFMVYTGVGNVWGGGFAASLGPAAPLSVGGRVGVQCLQLITVPATAQTVPGNAQTDRL